MAAILLISITLKATVVLTGAWLLTRAMARHSAASRHLVWTLAMVAVLALPAMQVAGPSWKLPVLPAAAEVVGSDPIDASTKGSDPVYAPTQLADVGAGFSRLGSETDVVAAAAAAETNPPPSREPALSIDWRVALGLVWLSGVVVALTRLAAGLAWVRRVTQRAVTVTDPDWRAAL